MSLNSLSCSLAIAGDVLRVVIQRSDRYLEAKILRDEVLPDGRRHLVCDRRVHDVTTEIAEWQCHGALVSEFTQKADPVDPSES